MSGSLNCREHKRVLWDEPQRLAGLDWAEADVLIFGEYVKYIEGDL